jgi:hypothetical protein
MVSAMESLTSHNPIGLHGLLRDSFTLLLLYLFILYSYCHEEQCRIIRIFLFLNTADAVGDHTCVPSIAFQ